MTFRVVEKGGVVVRLMCVQSSVWKAWSHDLTVFCLMHQRPTQPRGAVGMPQYFLFAWQVTHPILILLHQSRDDVFNDFLKKSSYSSSFVFMDHASPLILLQPDSQWKFNNSTPPRHTHSFSANWNLFRFLNKIWLYKKANIFHCSWRCIWYLLHVFNQVGLLWQIIFWDSNG